MGLDVPGWIAWKQPFFVSCLPPKLCWTEMRTVPKAQPSKAFWGKPGYHQPCFSLIIQMTVCRRWEKAMATHSSILAWKIPWMEEPGRLQSMGSLRVGHDWATSLSLFIFMHLRRKWQLTPVFLPGESQGQGSLVGCRLWGRTELDRTEVT